MADNSSTVSLILKVDDQGSVTIDQFNQKLKETEKVTEETSGWFKDLYDKAGKVVHGFTDLYFAGKVAWGILKEGVAIVDDFVNAAAEAEQVEKRMAFQLEQVGYNFKAIQPAVDNFATSILNTTRFSDELAREGLGRMMQYTTDVSKGMEAVRLAMDMSTQTGRGYEEMITMVGMAMSGNVERLGRWVPELKNLKDKLGDSATQADKAEYAMRMLNEKFGGAAQKDLDTYTGRIANLKNQWNEIKESIGRALMPLAEFVIKSGQATVGLTRRMGGAGYKSMAEIKTEMEAERAAKTQAEAFARIKVDEDELIHWKTTQDERQKINFSYFLKHAELMKDELLALDAQCQEEIQKAEKVGADTLAIRQYFADKEVELEYKKTQDIIKAMEDREKQKEDWASKMTGVAGKAGIATQYGMQQEVQGIVGQYQGAVASKKFTQDELKQIRDEMIRQIDATKEKYKGMLEGMMNPNWNQGEINDFVKKTWDPFWKAFETEMQSASDLMSDLWSGITGEKENHIIKVDDSQLLDTIKNASDLLGILQQLVGQEWKISVYQTVSTPAGTSTTEGLSTLSASQIDSALNDLAAKNRSQFMTRINLPK